MIKKFTINKIVIISMYVILISLFYLIPTDNIKTSANIEEKKLLSQSSIYLLDNDNYVSKVNYYFNKSTIEEEIRSKLNILINGIDSENNFYPIIPKDTKIISLKIDNDNVYINFNKELLKVNKYLEEQMIESIIYSLSDINGINNIYINVEGEIFDQLPNSKKEIPYPLNREFGINKKYDISNINKLEKTTIFFVKNVENESYYVPITLINNDETDKMNIIIEELKSSVYSQNNLNGIIKDDLYLSKYDIDDNKMNISFSQDIDSSILSNVIAYSIFENYDVDEVIFNNLKEKNINIIRK